MDSKTSYYEFNYSAPGVKSLIINNIKSTWPIWAGLTFLLSWIIPVSMLTLGIFNFNGSKIDYAAPFTAAEFLIIPFCVMMAIRLFGYLTKERATNFYHSLPYTRTTLFVTNVVSGYFLLLIPLVFVGILTTLIGISIKEDIILFMIKWFLLLCAECFYVYGFTVLMAIIFGMKIATYVMTLIMAFYVIAISNIYGTLFTNLHTTVQNSFYLPDGIFMFLSPATLATNISVDEPFYGLIKEYYSFENVWITVSQELIVGVWMLIVALFLYNKRKSERSGEVVTFNIFKVIFKWGFAFSFGAFLTISLGGILIDNLDNCLAVGCIQTVLYVFYVVLSFIIAEMILSKRFNVFYKIRYEILAAFIVSVIVSLILIFDLFGITGHVPDPSKVDKMNIDITVLNDKYYKHLGDGKYQKYYSDSFKSEKEGDIKLIEKFTELHEFITEQNVESHMHYMKHNSKYTVVSKDDCSYSYDVKMYITYKMKNGSETGRLYMVPYDYIEDYLPLLREGKTNYGVY